MKKVFFLSLSLFFLSAVLIFGQEKKEEHPRYLSALSDSKSCRFMIEHSLKTWKKTKGEEDAVIQINQAIEAIKKAGIDDKKDDHPKATEFENDIARLKKVVEVLKLTKADVEKAMEVVNKIELRKEVLGHINPVHQIN